MLASQRLELHKSEVKEIAKKYEQKGLCNLRVFGSVARGEDREDSDIDFLVDVISSLRPSLYTLIGLADDLEDSLGIKVDVITARSIPEQVRESIVSEAVSL
jgi:predicted nucleotidyltransferase